jgi:hypothetical protein
MSTYYSFNDSIILLIRAHRSGFWHLVQFLDALVKC